MADMLYIIYLASFNERNNRVKHPTKNKTDDFQEFLCAQILGSKSSLRSGQVTQKRMKIIKTFCIAHENHKKMF
jgi:hypothetical protein